MKNKIILLLIGCSFFWGSCNLMKTYIIEHSFKDAQVESLASIKEYQLKGHYDTSFTYCIKQNADSNFQEKFASKLLSNHYVFNQDGKALCYNGNVTCSGKQLSQLILHQIDSFSVCTKSKTDLPLLFSKLITTQNQAISFGQLPKADYYILRYWSTSYTQKNYKEEVEWISELIAQSPNPTQFVYLKINFDIRNDQGFPLGTKIPIQVKRTKKSYKIDIGNLPPKNNPMENSIK